MYSLLLLQESVTRYWNARVSIAVLGSLALQATVKYTNKCKILCINCGYTVIVWQGTELVKWNGSDVSWSDEILPVLLDHPCK
jgi:hypothetical protein